jgi:hypothetical protein
MKKVALDEWETGECIGEEKEGQRASTACTTLHVTLR